MREKGSERARERGIEGASEGASKRGRQGGRKRGREAGGKIYKERLVGWGRSKGERASVVQYRYSTGQPMVK